MAAASTKTFGCSGCLIEAIECGDAATLRQLLSAQNVQFTDTYWTPRSFVSTFIAPYPNCCKCFLLLTTVSQVAPRYCQQKRCPHSTEEGSLISGWPPHIAMSVMLSAMLFTTNEFNALQILIEKFDMSEPIVFRWFFQNCWNVVAVDTAGLALLLDRGSKLEDPTSSILLKTLQRNSLLKQEMALCLRKFMAK